MPCKGRTPGRKQSNGRGPSWTGVCPCCHRQEMPALTDRRYSAVCTNHRRLTGKVLRGAHFPMKSFCFCWESFLPFTGPVTIQMSDSVFRLNYENTIQLWFFASSPDVDASAFLHRPDHRGPRFRRRSAFGPGDPVRPNRRAARNPDILIRTIFRLHYVICRAGAKAKANRNTKLTRTRRFHIGTETRPTLSFRISTR